MLNLTKVERTLDKIEKSLKSLAQQAENENMVEIFNTVNRAFAMTEGVIYTECNGGLFTVYYDKSLESDDLFDLFEKVEIAIKEIHPTAKLSYIPVEIDTA